MIRPKARLGSRYQLDSSWYIRADKTIGRPGVIGGEDLNTGDRILVKQWLRDAGHADELREMWAHEIRQLHRLSGTADASEVILPMVDSGEDDQSFYLILRLGRRAPLHAVLDRTQSSSWLQQVRQRQNRILLWLNVKRIATGLAILHSQGVLHRRLDDWAVFTDGSDQPDFQLGGFEWSIRLADVEAKKKRRRLHHPDRVYYSFIDDWRDLGILLANLLGIRLAPNKRSFAQDISFLEPAEKDILKTLILASNYHDVDQETLLNRIEDAIDETGIAESHEPTQLVLACNLSPQSNLAKHIAAESNGRIDLADQEMQRRFIEADLSDSPLLIERKSGARRPQFVLQGTNNTYELNKFTPNDRAEATWAIAYCDRVSRYLTNPQQISRQRPIKPSLIRVESLINVKRSAKTLRGSTRRWDHYLGAVEDVRASLTRQDKCHASLVLLLLLESEIHRASAIPVTLKSHVSMGSDLTEIRIIPRRDEQRDALALALGLEPGAIRMRSLFEDGDVELDSEWVLSESDASNDEHVERSRWKFIGILKENDQQPIYRFQSGSVIPVVPELFLFSFGTEGTYRQLKRHGKALSALRDHEELLGVIDEPRQFLRRTADDIQENSVFEELDDVKKRTLRNAYSTLPVYLIQGPPGVGKTKLVAALADQQFVNHSSSRLLLTAQSHHAVDHLLDKVVSEVCKNSVETDFLVVRCRPRDATNVDREHDLRTQTKRLVHDLSQSVLMRSLSGAIASAISEADSILQEDTTGDAHQRASAVSVRAIESLVLRSASLVFSTTNSADLERLIEERAHFDLSLIEEAAKATGVELISPLMLSHKRIAIGDHRQLPPFASERRDALLADPGVLKNALSSGWPMVASSFRAVGLDDIVDWTLGLSNDEFEEIANISRGTLTLFETMVEREFGRQSEGAHTIAQKLNVQHRMHPVIASVVACTFYDEDLTTHPDAMRRFERGPAPIVSLDNTLMPLSPLLFIDVPYVQEDIGVLRAEELPPYHNPREAELVTRVLELLSPRTRDADPPSLAVLSPYKEQTRQILDAIKGKPHLVEHLEAFKDELGAGIHVGTVDSFQGNEADVVVISLVRNNHRSGLRALGFLRDARRMNVLLSRAKWQLIIVGSFQFLRGCVSRDLDEKGQPSFLGKFISHFENLERIELGNGVPAAMRVPASVLEGAVRRQV